MLAGRNRSIYDDVCKGVAALRPKVATLQRRIEPNEDEFAAVLRMADTRQCTVDPTDYFVQVHKSAKTLRNRPIGPRRFLPGNSAFVNMKDCPVLTKADMPKVTVENREAVFRGMTPNPKWAGNNKAPTQEGGSNAAVGVVAVEEPQQADDEDEDPFIFAQKADEKGKVVCFWMELHPKIVAQLLWESDARVFVDFSGATGLATRSAITLGIKVVAILNNRAHLDIFKQLTLEWLVSLIKAKNIQVTPNNFEQRVQELKGPRLLAYEQQQQQKKRKGSNQTTPEPKRAAVNCDGIMAAITSDVGEAKTKKATELKETVPVEVQNAPVQKGSQKPGEPGAALNDLLSKWGK